MSCFERREGGGVNKRRRRLWAPPQTLCRLVRSLRKMNNDFPVNSDICSSGVRRFLTTGVFSLLIDAAFFAASSPRPRSIAAASVESVLLLVSEPPPHPSSSEALTSAAMFIHGQTAAWRGAANDLGALITRHTPVCRQHAQRRSTRHSPRRSHASGLMEKCTSVRRRWQEGRRIIAKEQVSQFYSFLISQGRSKTIKRHRLRNPRH